MSNNLKTKKEMTLNVFETLMSMLGELKEETKMPDLNPLVVAMTKTNVGGGVKLKRIRKNGEVKDVIKLI